VGKPGYCSRYSNWLRVGKPRGWSSNPSRVKNFLHIIQTGSEAHPASYSVGTRGSSNGGKADHSPPTSAKIKKMGLYTSTPPRSFMAQCLTVKHWDEFTFYYPYGIKIKYISVIYIERFKILRPNFRGVVGDDTE
jgi:hypothetical protein